MGVSAHLKGRSPALHISSKRIRMPARRIRPRKSSPTLDENIRVPLITSSPAAMPSRRARSVFAYVSYGNAVSRRC